MQRNPEVVLGRLRHSLRRWQIVRRGLAVVAVIVLATTVNRARTAADQAAEQWDPDRTVWVAATPLPAGAEIATGDVVARPAPAALTPADATAESPVGARVTVAHAAGEILRDARLVGRDDSTVTSLIPAGHSAVTVDVDEDIFVVGDRVELYALLNGRLVGSGLVVAAHEGAVTVGVQRPGPVVVELGRGGVAVSLNGP